MVVYKPYSFDLSGSLTYSLPDARKYVVLALIWPLRNRCSCLLCMAGYESLEEVFAL